MFHRLIKSAIVAAALLPSVAHAQLYNNGAPNNSSGNEMTQWIQAEDFTLGAASTVTGIRFWGFSNGAPGYFGSITWRIYSNAGNNPAAILFSGTAAVAGINEGPVAPTGLTQFRYDIATNFGLGAGTYWLGLHNGPLTRTSRDEFYWQTTASNATNLGREDETPFDDANPWVSSGQEHAFQILGQVGTNVVPEPGTYALMAAGLLAVGFVRRRRLA